MAMKCEVRIPTYKRPDLLQRAISSLIAQDYPHWQALVMDDSPTQEAKSVVESFADDRLLYSPNPTNLGSAGNLDRAFTSHSLLGGTYACVLEDDNWLLPTFLSENIACLQASHNRLLLRNQAIWLQTQSTSQPTDRTTRGDWFTAKTYTPLELHAHLFFFEGISNGGLFWETSIQSQLQVGPSVTDAGLQEYCRTLQIQDPLQFEPTPLCCWSEMPINLSLRNPATNRVFGRGTQAIRMHLIQTCDRSIIKQAEMIAQNLDKVYNFELSLVDALYTNYEFNAISKAQMLKQYCKSYTKYQLIQNPLKEYLPNKFVA